MNPYLTNEFIEYLEAAGYQPSESMCDAFYKDDLAVIFKNDNVDVMVRTEEEPGERSACLSKYMSFWGISQLDMFGFMMLMHICRVVPLKNVIKAARSENGNQVHELFADIFAQFGFVNKKQVIENY